MVQYTYNYYFCIFREAVTLLKYLYSSKVSDFVENITSSTDSFINELVEESKARFDLTPSEKEVLSWKNSLYALANNILNTEGLAHTYIFIETRMPVSSNRCDVMIVGKGRENKHHSVIIELKQWGNVKKSGIKDEVIPHGEISKPHPSAQVRGYCNTLKHYHEAFHDLGVSIHGCSYLHNMVESRSKKDINSTSIFGTLPKEYPVYTSEEIEEFQNYLLNKLGGNDGEETATIIEEAGIKPSTKLLDVVDQAVQGNEEWTLLDEQLSVFNTITSSVEEAKNSNEKFAVIVKGGPGTGKSVLAIQLLAYASRHHWKISHATGSLAFNTVLKSRTQHFADDFMKRIHNVRYKNQLPVADLFAKSANVAKVGTENMNAFDLVVYDEAHRLWDYRKGFYGNNISEEPMINEVLNASLVSAFFLDDNQSVRANEIGTVEHIQSHAEKKGINVKVIELNNQYRCSGSSDYINWVDYAMDYSNNKTLSWNKYDAYDFRIMDSMEDMQQELDKLKEEGEKCRIVSGFCWKWSKPLGNGELVHDLKGPELGEWSAPWIENTKTNLKPSENRYTKWALDDDYYDQVGSIYSVQGFEFDYIGLIFGKDLVYVNGEWKSQLDFNKDPKFKKDLAKSSESAEEKLKNIYRVLMTRGMKGTFVYFLDKETENYFRDLLNEENSITMKS